MTMSLRALPLLILAFIIYNAIVFVSGLPPDRINEVFYGAFTQSADNKTIIQRGGELFSLPLPGGLVNFRLGDAMITFGLILLAFEMIKSTYTQGYSMIDRLLSPLLFVLFLIEFLLVPRCATSVFFFLTVMAGFDIIVGEVIGIKSARRDINFGGG
jgi:hypothetical protein